MRVFKVLFGIFILLHTLGDFYLQTDGLSENKNLQYRYVALHGLIYAAVFFAGSGFVWSAPIGAAALALSLLHIAIDSAKYICIKSRGEFSAGLYVIDQLLHVVSIAAVAAVFVLSGAKVTLLPAAQSILAMVTNRYGAVLGGACIALLICKPANITIKKILLKYRPDALEENTRKNVGAWIGTLERMIIALLLSVHQYSAIGLVLTAKSVARYDKISKDPAFAEYYLLGTLLSTLFVIITVFIFT